MFTSFKAEFSIIVKQRNCRKLIGLESSVSHQIITARFNSKYIKKTCVQVIKCLTASTNDAEPEVKDKFYEQYVASG